MLMALRWWKWENSTRRSGGLGTKFSLGGLLPLSLLCEQKSWRELFCVKNFVPFTSPPVPRATVWIIKKYDCSGCLAVVRSSFCRMSWQRRQIFYTQKFQIPLAYFCSTLLSFTSSSSSNAPPADDISRMIQRGKESRNKRNSIKSEFRLFSSLFT